MSINYTEEEKDLIATRAASIGVEPELIMQLGLPASIIDFISDDDLMNQLTVVKGYNIDNIPVQEPVKEVLEEVTEETTNDEEEIVEEETIEVVEEEPVVETKQKEKKKEKKQSKPKKQKEEPVDDDEFIKNIKILDVSHMHAYQNFNKHFDVNVPTYEVTLPQSGYNAKVRGLKADEIDRLRNSLDASEKSRRNTLGDIVYNCIVETGLKSFTKQDFMSGTAILDFDILLFGIMHQTFGAINDYSITCPHCRKSFNQKIVTDTLIRVSSETAGNEISKIIKSPNKDQQFKNSILNKYSKLVRIPETDIVIEFKFSNLNRDEYMVNQMGELSEEERSTRKFYLTWVANRVLLPQYDASGNYIGSVYIDSPMEIYRLFDKLKSSSYKKVIEEIGKIMDDHTVTFGTPEIPCIHCHKMIGSSKVDIVDYFLIEAYKEGL